MGRSHSLSSIPYFAPDPASDSIDSSDDRAKRAEARKQAYDQAFTAGLYDYGHGQASTPEPKIKKKESECIKCKTMLCGVGSLSTQSRNQHALLILRLVCNALNAHTNTVTAPGVLPVEKYPLPVVQDATSGLGPRPPT